MCTSSYAALALVSAVSIMVAAAEHRNGLVRQLNTTLNCVARNINTRYLAMIGPAQRWSRVKNILP